MFKVNNKEPKQHHCSRSGVLIVNFEQISHLFLLFILITLGMYFFGGNYQLVLITSRENETSVDLTKFTDFLCKEILTSLFSFSSINVCLPTR